jgi:hypothetical protein
MKKRLSDFHHTAMRRPTSSVPSGAGGAVAAAVAAAARFLAEEGGVGAPGAEADAAAAAAPSNALDSLRDFSPLAEAVEGAVGGVFFDAEAGMDPRRGEARRARAVEPRAAASTTLAALDGRDAPGAVSLPSSTTSAAAARAMALPMAAPAPAGAGGVALGAKKLEMARMPFALLAGVAAFGGAIFRLCF